MHETSDFAPGRPAHVVRRGLCAIFALCAFILLPAAADPVAEHWAPVLQHFVDVEGRIDFDGVAANREHLDAFVAWLAQTSPSADPADFESLESKLAFHINAYNALALYGVLAKGMPADFSTIFKRLGFFKLQRFELGGRQISLYDYENKIIRPLGEPRVHFVLNCMVRACPRLPRTPFVAEHLDAQLQAAAREFFDKEIHIRIDDDKRVVLLSEILDFYTEDFVRPARREKLIEYVNLFRAKPIPQNYRVQYIPYNWTLNQQP